MGLIEDSVSVYERLSKYKITIENGLEFVLSFEKAHYHHLVGFHYLTDLVGIANPPYGKTRFYRMLKNHKISESEITKSELYPYIAERVACFEYLEEIVSASTCKIIVEFDKDKADSDIEAKFFLYKRIGNALKCEAVTYYMLFIGQDESKRFYYPATYIVEHSNRYISEQTMLNCKIEIVS